MGKNQNGSQDKDLTLVYEAKDSLDADLTRTFLESHNIQTFVQGEHHRSLLGWLGSYVPLRLLVPKHSEEQARHVLKLKDGESRDVKLRSLPPYFVACLAFIAPGLCNWNGGNKKCASLIGGMAFICFLALLIVLASHSNIQIAGFVFMSLVSLIILDITSGLLYRKKQIKKYSTFLFAIVLIFSILWFPTLWFLIEEGASEHEKAISRSQATASLRIDDFKFTDVPEGKSVDKPFHPAVVRPYQPGETIFFSLSFHKYTHGPASLNAVLDLYLQGPDGTTSKPSSLELKGMPPPYVMRGAETTLPSKMADGQYSLIFKVHDNDFRTETTYSVPITVKTAVKN